jgi:hypothetical protein
MAKGAYAKIFVLSRNEGEGGDVIVRAITRKQVAVARAGEQATL